MPKTWPVDLGRECGSSDSKETILTAGINFDDRVCASSGQQVRQAGVVLHRGDTFVALPTVSCKFLETWPASRGKIP